MKTSIILIAACAFCMGASARGPHAGGGGHSGSGHSGIGHSGSGQLGGGHVNSSNHNVSGHTTKDGTYVAPSHATNPNFTKTDNYSQKGNVNPFTGKEGTKE